MEILCLFLLIVCYFDYRLQIIPNKLLLLLFCFGIGRAIFSGGGLGAISFLVQAVVVIFLLYPFFRIGTLGAGDLKLLGLCSGCFSQTKIPFFLFYSFGFAAIVSIVHFLRRGDALERFGYCISYLKDVMKSGRLKMYFENDGKSKRAGICLAGPILCSVLLYLGGIY